jgi:nucleoside-diphosphate-sugar epimerase
MMGFSLGNKLFATIGNGRFVLPYVYVDNLVGAIVAALENDNSKGEIYNVVDPERMTKENYIKSLLKRLYPKAHYINIPYWFLYSAVYFQELLTGMLGRRPFLTRYRLTSSQRSIVYDSSRIEKDLGWKPVIAPKDAIDKILAYETAKNKPAI